MSDIELTKSIAIFALFLVPILCLFLPDGNEPSGAEAASIDPFGS